MTVTSNPLQHARHLLGRAYRHLKRQVASQVFQEAPAATPHPVDALFVNGCDIPACHRYRVSHQREQLEFWGHSTYEVHYTAVDPALADTASVIICYRCPITDAVKALIERAHAKGVCVFFDVDDLVIDTKYTDALPVVQAMSPEDKRVFDDGVIRNGRTLALCDAAICSTERLAHELKRYVPRVYINRNVASQEMVELSDAASKNKGNDAPVEGSVVLGYFSGSMTHNADFAEALSALAVVMAERPQVKLKVVGDLELPGNLQQFTDRIIHAPRVSWQELPELIASVDINLAPLEDTLFNEAKSENKWTEAALVRVPTVASNVGAFARMIRDGETGVLCSNTQEWRDGLLRLIDDPGLRQHIGAQAYDYCMEHCTTMRSGYVLSQTLFNDPRDLDHLISQDESARHFCVSSYLKRCGIVLEKTPEIDPKPWLKPPFTSRLDALKQAHTAGHKTAVLIYERQCGDDATFRYFGYNVSQRLMDSENWRGAYFFDDELNTLAQSLDSVDVILFIRCRIRPELTTLANAAKERGVHIAYLIDDNAVGAAAAPRIIRAMASEPPTPFEIDFWTGVTKRFQMASQLADCLIAPNAYLADLLQRQEGKPACVIHSSLNDEQIDVSDAVYRSLKDRRDSATSFTIGYFSGTASHNADFRLVEKPLVSFLRTHDHTRLLLGGHLGISEDLYELIAQDKVTVLPPVDYATLQYLQASCSIVLAPLEQDEFTNCKSALKIFEAGAVGSPALASPTFSNNEAVVQGKSGFLCSTEEDWLHSIEVLYSDPARCVQMSVAAHDFALSHYHGKAIQKEIEDALDSVLAADIQPYPEHLSELMNRSEIKNWDDPFEANPVFAALG